MRARAGHAGIVVLRVSGSRLAVLAVVLLSAGWLYTGPTVVHQHATETPFGVDYLSFDAAGTIVSDGRAGDLYDDDIQRDVQQARSGSDDRSQYYVWLYPPAVAAAFSPLADLRVEHGYLAYVMALCAGLVAIGGLLWGVSAGLRTRTRAVFIVCTLGSSTLGTSVVIGQLTPLLMVAALAGLLLLVRSAPLPAGLILGLLFVKPHFGLAALGVLLLAKQRKAAAGAAAAALALALGSLVLAGFDGVESYVAATWDAARTPTVSGASLASEQSVYGIAATLFGVRGGPVVSAVHSAVVLGVLYLVIRAARGSRDTSDERARYLAGLAALLAITVSPHIQYYDLALMLFPALFIVGRAQLAESPALRECLIGVLVLMVVCLEVAGVLASGKLSVSAPLLLAFTLMYCNWAPFEARLCAAISEREGEAEPERLRRAA